MRRSDVHIKAGYRTYSGNTMIIEVGGHWVPRDVVPVVHLDDYKDLCGACKGLNGGCSQFAPYFDWIKPSMTMLYVIDVKLDMAWAIKYAYRHSDNIIKHNFFRCGYADLLTDRYLWGIVKKLGQQIDNSYALGVGHCHGCSKKNCTVLRGEYCIKPRDRYYSIEATGVECSALNKMLYGSYLPWWFKSDALPVEMRRYSGLLCNENTAIEGALIDVVRTHRSYISVDEVTPMPMYDMDIVDAPSDSMDAGRSFPMYVSFEDGLVQQEES